MTFICSWRAFLICFITLATLSGCLTASLHEDHLYREEVSSLLISSDSKKIVIIGKEYHYIFDAPPQLIFTLNSPLQKNSTVVLREFKVDTDHNIAGIINIRTNLKESEETTEKAILSGFDKAPGGSLSSELNLKGIRYSAENFTGQTEQYRLSKTYTVGIVEVQSDGERFSKGLLTPVTVAADGAMALSAIVLSPIWIPVLLSKF